MAQVFGTPKGFPEAPDFSDFIPEGKKFGVDVNAYFKAVGEWNEKLAEWCRENTDSNSDLVGEVVNFQIADGYASYMVYRTKPLQILHLPHGDAYQLQDFATRGLRVGDIRKRVEFDRKWKELGEKQRKERAES